MPSQSGSRPFRRRTAAPRPSSGPPTALILTASVLLVAGCGGGGPAGEATATPPAATEAEWAALATPRPTPMDGAPRVSLGETEVLADPAWPTPAGVTPALAVQSLAAAGLLERRDVEFVERRRFQAAAEAERRGERRPRGAPAAGVSRGAELLAHATWSSVGLPRATLELRLADAATGETVAVRRSSTPPDAGPAVVARALVEALTAALADDGLLPEAPGAGVGTRGPPPSPAAVEAFLRGLAAEDRWAWEAARVAYQEALARTDAFPEAEAALARAARLRNGGTLGES